MLDFIEGEPPKKSGHYWVRVSCSAEFTKATKIAYSVGAYCWRCGCHPESLNGLSERHVESIGQGHKVITGYLQLPNPKRLNDTKSQL
jgi:hypothetical protein